MPVSPMVSINRPVHRRFPGAPVAKPSIPSRLLRTAVKNGPHHRFQDRPVTGSAVSSASVGAMLAGSHNDGDSYKFSRAYNGTFLAWHASTAPLLALPDRDQEPIS